MVWCSGLAINYARGLRVVGRLLGISTRFGFHMKYARLNPQTRSVVGTSLAPSSSIHIVTDAGLKLWARRAEPLTHNTQETCGG